MVVKKNHVCVPGKKEGKKRREREDADNTREYKGGETWALQRPCNCCIVKQPNSAGAPSHFQCNVCQERGTHPCISQKALSSRHVAGLGRSH